nr:MAG TPA: hypothetical protein [Caudoviricetes sp.]
MAMSMFSSADRFQQSSPGEGANEKDSNSAL